MKDILDPKVIPVIRANPASAAIRVTRVISASGEIKAIPANAVFLESVVNKVSAAILDFRARQAQQDRRASLARQDLSGQQDHKVIPGPWGRRGMRAPLDRKETWDPWVPMVPKVPKG
jgi:hypothetical protein